MSNQADLEKQLEQARKDNTSLRASLMGLRAWMAAIRDACLGLDGNLNDQIEEGLDAADAAMKSHKMSYEGLSVQLAEVKRERDSIEIRVSELECELDAEKARGPICLL